MDKDLIIEKDYDDWTDKEIEFMSTQDDCCDECGHPIDDENYIGEYEDRGEYWGSPCTEYVTTGYLCDNCGHVGKY